MKQITLILVIAISALAFKSDKPVYQLYDNTGKQVNYAEMIKGIQDADIIFFGEYHDNPISHWLELEVTKSLHEQVKENLILSTEMFESDNQIMLDEYLKGMYSVKKFEENARLWPNYKTDYKPLLLFAKDNNLHFVAANVPRRYASMTYKLGFEGLEKLSPEAKKFVAPLPITYDKELGCYKSMLEMQSAHGMAKINENLPKAQAVKDATMAHFINKYWSKGKKVIHFNGSFHSDNHEGTVWYLKNLNKDLKIVTIATALQSDVSKINDDEKSRADFIIVVDENITRTH